MSVAKLSLGLLVLAVVCLTIPQGLLVQRRRLKPQYAAQLQRPAWEPVDAALALMPPSDTRALLAYEVSRFRAICPPRWQQTVAAYAAFHARALAEARAWVAAGAQEGPTKPKTPFIIWRCRDSPGHAYNNTVDDDCGGLGDRRCGMGDLVDLRACGMGDHRGCSRPLGGGGGMGGLVNELQALVKRLGGGHSDVTHALDCLVACPRLRFTLLACL